MARRMFSDEVTATDAFLDMPSGAQLLYFHLGMSADDDGFIASPKMVMRAIRAGEDDLKILFVKKFLLPFPSGVCVVKHWRMNNQIRKDRYRETKYTEEKSTLFIRENGAYSFDSTKALPVPKGHFSIPDIDSGNHLATERQPSIGKVSIGKESIVKKAKRFIKPTIAEIKAYCEERNNTVDANKFFDFYESKGWYVGKNPMKDWKAAVRTWEGNRFNNSSKVTAKPNKYDKFNSGES